MTGSRRAAAGSFLAGAAVCLLLSGVGRGEGPAAKGPPSSEGGRAPYPEGAAAKGPSDRELPKGRPFDDSFRSPLHIRLSQDGLKAYVVNHTRGSISIVDVRGRKVEGEFAVGRSPAHAALSPDGKFLYVTSLRDNALRVVDLSARRTARVFKTGLGPYAVEVSSDGSRLFVVESLSDRAACLDAASGRTLWRVPVGREAKYLAVTPDGGSLIVGNGLSRSVSILDARTGKLLETRDIGRASVGRQVACTPDGRWALGAHLVSHDEQITTQINRGWMHSNGFTVMDLSRRGRRVTLLLDKLLDGAANPWGLALSADGRRLYVSLSGVHEVAFVDLERTLAFASEVKPEEVVPLERDVELMVEKKSFARRVPSGGKGPRGLALSESLGELLVANYFDDTVSVLDAESGELKALIALHDEPPRLTLRRKGEFLFNDGGVTFERWFSCASCHQEDATVDGLNWDLLNDGIGNPKNNKSMHDAVDTPPAMWSGVRENMAEAVAAGQRFAGFFPDPEKNRALLEYISTPERVRSPYRDLDSAGVRRGARLFLRARCDACHPSPTYTDRKMHDLGLVSPNDAVSRFDTPSLRECWRTAPYLHDGRAATLEEVLTLHDPRGAHGRTKGFSRAQLRDLLEYVRSL